MPYSLFDSLKAMLNHPLNRRYPVSSLMRWFVWQVRSRLFRGLHKVAFANGTSLWASSGMTGVTGNIYSGLHEFEDMSFVLHFLRPNDLFLDVGANCGTYSVLAASVGASVISYEPVPTTFNYMEKNIALNQFHKVIQARNLAISNQKGMISFTKNLDTMNHVITEDEKARGEESIDVATDTLDKEMQSLNPVLIKIDVEGYEKNVLDGGHATFSNEGLLAVIMEINGSGNRYCSDENQLHMRMISYGFEAYTYHPLEERRLRPFDFDEDKDGNNVIYIRDYDNVVSRLSEAKPFKVRNRYI